MGRSTSFTNVNAIGSMSKKRLQGEVRDCYAEIASLRVSITKTSTECDNNSREIGKVNDELHKSVAECRRQSERVAKVTTNLEGAARSISDARVVLQQLSIECHKNGQTALHHALLSLANKLHSAIAYS